jgi:uncharacterized protein
MLTVSLPAEFEQYVHQMVTDGKYRNEQEVVLDAIRLLRDSNLRHEQLRAGIREALDSVDGGDGIELDGDEALAAFFDELETEVRAELASENVGRRCAALGGRHGVMDKRQLLERLKSLLRPAFGDRLCGLVLYGSEARGAASPDSDIDVLVLLRGPVRTGEDIEATTRAIYPLMLEIDRVIDAKPVDIDRYNAGIAPLYRSVQREGINA